MDLVGEVGVFGNCFESGVALPDLLLSDSG